MIKSIDENIAIGEEVIDVVFGSIGRVIENNGRFICILWKDGDWAEYDLEEEGACFCKLQDVLMCSREGV